MASEIDPLVASVIAATQEAVDETRQLLDRTIVRRNQVFALARARGVRVGAIAALTGMTHQAVSKAMRDGEE